MLFVINDILGDDWIVIVRIDYGDRSVFENWFRVWLYVYNCWLVKNCNDWLILYYKYFIIISIEIIKKNKFFCDI